MDEIKTSLFSKDNCHNAGSSSSYKSSWVVVVHYLSTQDWAYNKAWHGDVFSLHYKAARAGGVMCNKEIEYGFRYC